MISTFHSLADQMKALGWMLSCVQVDSHLKSSLHIMGGCGVVDLKYILSFPNPGPGL